MRIEKQLVMGGSPPIINLIKEITEANKSNYVKKKKKNKKVRLPLECVPIPFWNKIDEKLANSYSFSIVRDSLTNCM